mgnify:CR=1 FL=1
MLSPTGGSDEMDHLAHRQCRRDLGRHLPRGLLAPSCVPVGMLVRGAPDRVRWKGTVGRVGTKDGTSSKAPGTGRWELATQDRERLTPEERAWYPVLRYVGPLINWAIRCSWHVLWSWRARR